MPHSEKAWQKIEYAVFVFLTVALAAVTLYLTLHQTSYAWQGITDTGYHSDVLAYMQETMGMDSGYSFPYPVLFTLAGLLAKALPITWAMALAITVFQTVSFVLLRYFFRRYLTRKVPEAIRAGWGILCTLAAFALLFYSMIFVYNHPFPGTRFYYMGVFSPNPFHNATYMAMRPFCIACVFWFADLLETYEEKFEVKKALLFATALFFATMTKPSFTLVFCGAAGLIMLYRLLRSKGANFRNTLLLGCMFLPTFAALLYQFGGVFVGTDSKGQEAGIGFSLFRVWKEYCSNYIVAIVLMIFFPLTVLLFQYRKLKSNTLYRFGWQLYAMSLAMFILLYEKGFRAVDANFSWGYMIGAFFVVMGSLLVLLEETALYRRRIHAASGETEKDSSVRKKTLPALVLQWGAFGLHVCCGLVYFAIILTGGSYY